MSEFDRFTRRRLLTLAGVVIASPLLAALPRFAGADEHSAHSGHSPQVANEPADTGEFIKLPQPRALKLAVNLNAVCLAPVVIAHGQGFFKQHNLDVELVNFGNSTEVLLEAIATGKADAGVGMALRWLKALEQGFDVKLTAGTHGGCLRLLSAANGSIQRLEDLKGKTIGVTDMASPDRNFFSILLKKHGVDPVRDVDWRLYPADLLGTALERGEVQAVSGSDPFMYRLIAGGKAQELATNLVEEYANLSCCVVGVTGQLVREDKRVVAALTQAILEAHDYAAQHPEAVAEGFQAYALNTSVEEVVAILHDHTHAHHAVGAALTTEISTYVTDLQGVEVISPSTDAQAFAREITADVFS
ncbi:ABC transporter substrate-binding protein [Pseudomonas sp. 5P_3.1_Bac2]|uniref:ABC transporter substrate-binding protein n=1 Tax=Pseudomonas sp. 5P_3.1_Bac2 TaxID=2971617 RepID=UPI0021C886A9|nr:ABC transporter substrate-binding protein [Pseudomonas sp. 5P_3.1_Bac2]MCU1717210.1 ABC transporter substrate-binding protein [Pseudomonas sp. 5P_3.1_Bac2]